MLGARLGMRTGILVSGRPFGHALGMRTGILEPMFVQQVDILVPVWTHGWAFWCLVAHLDTSMGILVPGCPFGKVGMCLGMGCFSMGS